MPKEICWGSGREFFYGKDGGEYYQEDAKQQNEQFYRRGVIVRWDNLGMVQLATGPVRIVDHAEGTDSVQVNYMTFDDPRGLAHLIRELKKAGRQAFGESAW